MLTLILGGARSGKSRYAQSLCLEKKEVFYLATARRDDADEEMTARIERHKLDRPPHWEIIEEPLDLIGKIERDVPENATVLVDCLTVWLSNLMWEERGKAEDELENSILRKAGEFAAAARNRNVIAVSNEVGSGIVPDNPVGRSFRDLQGLTNQVLAWKADRVILVVAGLPLTLKGVPY